MGRAQYYLSDFDFELPQELIAQHPAPQRSASRLLYVSGARHDDLEFAALPELLSAGDLLVLNDTRVVRSRLFGHKPSGGQVELLLERLVGDDEAWMQVRASHVPKVNGVVRFADGTAATVLERDGRFVRLRFAIAVPLLEYLEGHGEVPLPPYIVRTPGEVDAERYQTVYARHPGAVAAPTAGLHFDDDILARLQARGVAFAYVTLHVGAGTFQPVESENLARHSMHSERFHIPQSTVAAIESARAARSRVIAVGTTSLRALESAAIGNSIRAGAAETTLFITPGYRFRVADRLLTNFHMPKSTLLMLVCAFAGYDAIRSAYAHAIRERYRFFSYGDAMLLEREGNRVEQQ